MRIAFFAWESLHSVTVGGIAPHATELAAALQRRGHEVHVFTRKGPDQSGYQEFYGVHYHRVDYHDTKGADMLADMDNMSNAMAWAFAETQNHVGCFDICAAHDWMTAKALAQCRNDHQKVCIFTFHSSEQGRTLGKGKQSIMALEAEGAYVADRVIAVSDKLKAEITYHYGVPASKIAMIYNGVQCARYDGYIDPKAVKEKYGIGCMDPVILFVARMSGGMKGTDLLLEGMPAILNQHGGAKAVFVGDGDAKMHCDHRSKELGIEGSCRFLGQKSGQELVDLYKACDVVCVPSRNEPFGLVVLEAWAAGKPVVVSDQVGCPVTPGVEGFVVSCTPEGVAWGINETFKNFDHAKYMGKKGRDKAAFSFSWDSVAAQTEGMYYDVLKWTAGGRQAPPGGCGPEMGG